MKQNDALANNKVTPLLQDWCVVWVLNSDLESSKTSGFPAGSAVKNLPATQETWLCPLGQEAPLVEGTATHSSVLAWRIPTAEEPGRLQSMGSQRVACN